MKKLLKFLLIFLATIVGLFVLLYAFLSPIAKYIVEKNSVKWTGRCITVGNLDVNLFGGKISITDIKVYEPDNTTIFFCCKDIYIKTNFNKLLNKDYTIDSLVLDNPEISIAQNGNKFNFDDLIKRFGSDTVKKPAQPDTHYDIKDVHLINGSVTYNNISVHNIFKLHELNIILPEFSSNNPNIKVHTDFNYGIGGAFNIDLNTNLKTLSYDLFLAINRYDLKQYYAPLTTVMNVSSLKGELTTKLRMHGKFNSPTDFSLHGYLNMNDVEIKDGDKRKFFAMNKFSLDVDSIDVKHNHYDVNHFILYRPFVAYDLYPNGNNMSRIMKRHEAARSGKDTITGKEKTDYSNIFTFISSRIKAMAIDFLSTNYHADSIAIFNGEFAFNDYTPKHNFHYNVTKLNLVTSEISDLNDGVSFHATAKLGDSGKLNVRANLRYDHRKKLFNYKVDTLKFSDISPIAKYVLERNSVKWIGRCITTGKIKVNAVKGSVYIKDIKIYEPDSSTVFFACHDVYLRINLMEMFDNKYHVEKIKIDNPEISIVQNGNNFNFDDLTKRFSPDPQQQTDTNSPPIHFDVDSIMINHGDITYNNVPVHNIFKITDLNFRLPQIRWDDPVSRMHLDFNYGIGGFFNIDMDANRNTLRYNTSISITNYDLSQYYSTVNNYVNISSIKGTLNTQLRIHGKFNKPSHISGTGYIHVNDLEIKDSTKQKVFALGELALNIDTINVKHNIFYLNNVILDKPFIRFDYYPKGNNISQMIRYTEPASAPVKDTSTGEIKPDYSNIFTLLASSVKMMSVDLVNSNYHTDSITIRHGQFLYNDYTLNKPFHYNITDLDIATDKLSAAKKSIQFNVFATLNDTGKLAMNADISLDMKNMLINYTVTALRLSDLNPYMEYYVGVPFENGYMRYQSTDSVINRNLKSSNLIHIDGIEVGKKSETKAVYNMPVRMAVSLLKDEKGNIDLNLPASGNLDDPDYKIGKLVGRVLGEMVVKTAESPFRLLAKLFNKDPEDMKQVEFDYAQEKLAEKQLRKLEDVYKVLEKKKELNVEIVQVIDSLEEKDELALLMAKKQYYLETKRMVNDSLLSRRKRRKALRAEGKIATQDTLFDKYLNGKLNLTGNELMTIEDKCIQLLGDTMLNREVHNRIENRNKEITEYLVRKKLLRPERVRVTLNKDSTRNRNSDQPAFDIHYKAEDK